MNKMVKENIVTKLEREGEGGWGNEKTLRPDGMGESEEAFYQSQPKGKSH